jgi:hypothetical protein
MNIGLPDIPYGYSRPFVEESYCMSEESKKELLMDNGVDVEKKLQDELAKQIIEDQETFKLMEELLPKLIALLPTKGINLKEKIDNIKKRLGVSYVDVLWKALVCLDENCTFPIDGIDYDKRNGETR